MSFTFFSILKPYEEDEEVEFYLKFCSDVLLEVLQFGDRRRLTELERVGRRFHHLVEKWFGEMPFLRLYMHLKPGFVFFVRHKLKFIIDNFSFSELEALVGSDREEISLANLAKFPPFLRFNEVLLNYHHGSLLTKCRLFEECLDSIKPALKDSNKTCFAAKINQADPNDFSDHSTVVIYLRDILLPLCDSSRSYEFNISFELDENSTTKIISSILQISQVGSCSNVSINLFNYYFSTRLPVDDISNWLAPKTVEGAEICGKKGENRFLIIHSNTIQTIPNMKEMWEHLMEVNFFTVSFFHRPHLEI